MMFCPRCGRETGALIRARPSDHWVCLSCREKEEGRHKKIFINRTCEDILKKRRQNKV